MASPESTKPDPKSPIVQESPVFTYLSNLSPLKPVESRQPYADISCPTPEPVFTSPHFICPREPNLLKRLSGAERFSSGHNDRTMEPSAARMIKLVPYVIKRCSENGAYQDQPCSSPTTCVDAFLADPSEDCDVSSGSPEHHRVARAAGLAQDVRAEHPSIGITEHSTSTGLPDLNLTQPAALPHDLWSDSTKTKGSTMKPHVAKTNTGTSTRAVAGSSSGYGFEEDPVEVERSVLVNLLETESTVKMVDKAVEVNQASLDGVPKNVSVDADSAIVSASETAEWNRSDCTPQLRPEPLQNVQARVDHLDGIGAKSITSISYDQEDGIQHQRGMRKRLQFEALESSKTSSDFRKDSWILTSNVCVESPVTSLDTEPANASNKETIAASGDKQSVQSISGNSLCRFSCKINSSVQNTGSPPVSVPRTLGIGLHLNSIVGPININVNMHLPDDDLSGQGDNLLSVGNSQVSQYPKNNLPSRSLLRCHSVKSSASSDNLPYYSATENSEEKRQGNQEEPNCSHQTSLNTKPLSSCLQSKPMDSYVTPCNIKKRASENASRTESSQRSPRKKMKKAPETEGCKHCNCKRSKCLKLYCDCFAAGVFCSEGCACQECYNKPDHEDIVRETRKQIESRNPLAFAPKVVVRASNPSRATADSDRVTPTSVIHKRGCNCKKSLCLKKYCECFQAGVGCSFGCRCEGCRNSFGRKYGDDITGIESEKCMEISLERGPSIGNLEGVEVKKGIVNNERCNTRLSPLTPLYQDTNGNEVARSQLPSKYYISPDCGASISPSCVESPSSPMNSISSNAFAKEAEGNSSLVTYNHGLGCHSAVQMDFSPGWDGFPDICNFSPLPNSSPQESGVSSAREPKTFHAKLFQGSGRLSTGSLRWRSSPITPLPQLGEHKFVMEPDSHSGLHKHREDDTPEILKDSCSPIKVVKASSPNQKRISPPHKELREMRSNSSPSLRSGRKFILQSVPSFPPLTPYSKNTREHDT